MQEQIKTNIALALNNSKLNTILIDVSPEYTGDLQEDGSYINKITIEALFFANTFLEKGGTVVCKALKC